MRGVGEGRERQSESRDKRMGGEVDSESRGEKRGKDRVSRDGESRMREERERP